MAEAQSEIKDELMKSMMSIMSSKDELENFIKNKKQEVHELEKNIESLQSNFQKSIREKENDFYTESNSIRETLITEIDSLKEAANKNISAQNSKFDEVHAKVSSLLPYAAVESIAYSYDASAERHDADVEKWNNVFFGALFAMFLVPIFVSFIFSIKMSNASTTDLLNIVLRSIPFEAPVIWLAVYAAKQGKKSKRLLEEYFYKYTTATTFIGMQKSIFEQNTKYKMFTLESQNQQELNRKFVNSIFENPSLTLENCVSADMPIEELAPLLDKVGPENIKLLLETIGKAAAKSS